MAPEDRAKTSFVTPWGIFRYKVMPFGLKIAWATYQRAITALFHDMMHKQMEIYVDVMITKSKIEEAHLADLQKIIERFQKFDLKLNPNKCVFRCNFR